VGDLIYWLIREIDDKVEKRRNEKENVNVKASRECEDEHKALMNIVVLAECKLSV
jgi:hypothetical protein